NLVFPIKRRKKVKHAASHPHEHLKIFKIEGYYGRISDLELAVYAIDNAVALKIIVINPRCTAFMANSKVEKSPKRMKAARSSAERQLRPIVPQGLKLVIL
ncbi:F-box domain containing protein, partial [Tanacetum coccineum]